MRDGGGAARAGDAEPERGPRAVERERCAAKPGHEGGEQHRGGGLRGAADAPARDLCDDRHAASSAATRHEQRPGGEEEARAGVLQFRSAQPPARAA